MDDDPRNRSGRRIQEKDFSSFPSTFLGNYKVVHFAQIKFPFLKCFLLHTTERWEAEIGRPDAASPFFLSSLCPLLFASAPPTKAEEKEESPNLNIKSEFRSVTVIAMLSPLFSAYKSMYVLRCSVLCT